MRWRITCALALLLWLLPAPVPGQEVRTYEPFVPTQEFREAFRMVDRGQTREGVQKFREIAARNPGTTLGAMSLFRVAFSAETPVEQRATYQAIIVGYPRSRFEIDARVALALMDYPEELPRLRAYDGIAQAFGGPSLQELLGNQSRTQVVRKLRSLPPEIQDGLAELYPTMGAILQNGLHREEDALRMAMFVREAFINGATSARAASTISYILTIRKFGESAFRGAPTPVPPREPEVTIRSPKSDHQTGPRPKIRVVCTVEDYRQLGINVGGLQLKLDGQDLRPVLEVRTKYDTSLKPNRPYERMLLIARPPQRLSPGRHTITLEVPGGNSVARRTWSFRVSRDRDDAEDECDDGDDW